MDLFTQEGESSLGLGFCRQSDLCLTLVLSLPQGSSASSALCPHRHHIRLMIGYSWGRHRRPQSSQVADLWALVAVCQARTKPFPLSSALGTEGMTWGRGWATLVPPIWKPYCCLGKSHPQNFPGSLGRYETAEELPRRGGPRRPGDAQQRAEGLAKDG